MMCTNNNLKIIKTEIKNATLIAVTKNHEAAELSFLLQNNINHFGENRVDEFLNKKKELQEQNIIWHFIGTLQTKKIKKIINEIDYLHSLESEKQLIHIEKYRKQPLKCFIQVNTTKHLENSKHGVTPNELIAFYEETLKYSKIKIIGLMTMAAPNDDKAADQSFKNLLNLKNKINQKFPEKQIYKLSMGMSSDYKIAVQNGATYVRIGSKLFN